MSANTHPKPYSVPIEATSAGPEDTERPKKRRRKTKCAPIVFKQILENIGLSTETWTELDTLDVTGCAFVLANKDLINSLPLLVRGNLKFITSENPLYRRKTLCGLARRLARELSGAVIRQRTQIRVNKKTTSKYKYKLIF